MKKIRFNKLLALASPLVATPFLLVACNKDNGSNPGGQPGGGQHGGGDSKDKSDKKETEFDKIYNEVDQKYNYHGSFVDGDFTVVVNTSDDYKIDLVKFSADSTKKKEEIYPTEIKKEDIQLKLDSKLEKDYTLENVEMDAVLDQKGINITNWFGSLVLTANLKHKSDQSKSKKLRLIYTDFRRNNKGFEADKSVVYDDYQKDVLKADKMEFNYFRYKTLTDEQKFEFDNRIVIRGLKSHYANTKGTNLEKYRTELNNVSEDDKKAYNEKAAALKLDTFENSYIKGSNIPLLQKGENKGFFPWLGEEIGKGGNTTDAIGHDFYRFEGLARTLPNDMYKKIAKQTLQMEISYDEKDKNGQTVGRTSGGTIWILDYQKPAHSNSYPTKWYFGTNLHVADNLNRQLKTVQLNIINKDKDLDKTFDLVRDDERFNLLWFHKPALDSGAISIVYKATDFLNTKPEDYVAEARKKDVKGIEEFADFAVIEIDFDKLQANREKIKKQNGYDSIFVAHRKKSKSSSYEEYPDTENRTKEQIAQFITNDYANRKEDHIKFLKTSYLQNYEKVAPKLFSYKSENYKFNGDSLYALGYPGSGPTDYFLTEGLTSDQAYHINESAKETFSLWVNQEGYLYNKWNKEENKSKYEFSKEVLDKGTYLSNQIGYRTFKDKRGVIDSFLTANFVGDGVFTTFNKEKYLPMTLDYAPKSYVPNGGSSGSSVRNQNNEIVSIFHAATAAGRIGLSTAFRSEGKSYNGLYGNYELPQYDLIYGGGKNQKSSFREALKEKYGNNVKTNLFENITEIPNDYKFQK
ncbi:Ig-specific serine endopeptidase MIP [Mycoplasma procyoni]|uniref:Ig-specific serine endopeptidase MIP n=1 Tax=Mycoplasma procyoni TaxID=568784 RepID=UPI00197B73F4|nr:DUF31 family protein [Mycoplasma procyoni]MBN3534451.1 DUF31 family protein [Mycoplasma procyoni]